MFLMPLAAAAICLYVAIEYILIAFARCGPQTDIMLTYFD